MQLFIDGVAVKMENDVKIVIEDLTEEGGELHVTLTHQEVITEAVDEHGKVAGAWLDAWHDLFDTVQDAA
jgi:hypothetical protein